MKDLGLQPERTRLAWLRTGFAMLLVAALSLHLGLSAPDISRLAAALVAGLAAIFMFFQGGSNWANAESLSKADCGRRRRAVLTGSAVMLVAVLHAAAVLFPAF